MIADLQRRERARSPPHARRSSRTLDQDNANVDRLNCEQVFLSCPSGSPPWDDTFHRGHPVNVHVDCGTYVVAKDLWSCNYLWMRRDALKPC